MNEGFITMTPAMAAAVVFVFIVMLVTFGNVMDRLLKNKKETADICGLFVYS
ncbi:hypothetical protein [Peribacillus kribbensis]|uniref:hypothetical protein n=1 Tax=Peribacillus kribbensis TaxID=356658 RepID=UPI0004214060|nr:hypothetical protein [Peribacillus kribbensis]